MSKPNIPIMKPLLPSAETILPYLQEIDQNHWYSNLGPLVQKLELRMCQHFNLPDGCVGTLSSGTSAIIDILRALDVPSNYEAFAILPSWTFIATPASAIAVGLTPYFADVDSESWALTPEIVKKILPDIPGKVGVVIPVCPFGVPQDVGTWDVFTEETGIPVVIDAAAAFDSITSVPEAAPGRTPMAVSLHATKVLGMGEGGMAVSTNTDLIARVREMSNFGFHGYGKKIERPGTNSKMSEYAAAVGHAALDHWQEKRDGWLKLKLQYINALTGITNDQITSPWLAEEWISSTCNIRLSEGNAEEVIERLAEHGIESRRWWGRGCHRQPAYAGYPQHDLSVTRKLGESVIALPFSIDMHQEDIYYVVRTLDTLLQGDIKQ